MPVITGTDLNDTLTGTEALGVPFGLVRKEILHRQGAQTLLRVLCLSVSDYAC